MPCCSVTQSQEVGPSATVGRKTIMMPNLRVAISNMCSDHAACPPDSMTHLFRAVVGEIRHGLANNYYRVFTMAGQRLLFFGIIDLRYREGCEDNEEDGVTSHIHMSSCLCFLSLFSLCSLLSLTTLLYFIPSGTKLIITSWMPTDAFGWRLCTRTQTMTVCSQCWR